MSRDFSRVHCCESLSSKLSVVYWGSTIVSDTRPNDGLHFISYFIDLLSILKGFNSRNLGFRLRECNALSNDTWPGNG